MLHSNLYLNQLYSLPSGTKQANLSNDNVINIVMPIPPINEREEIATYIKFSNNKIDKAINSQQKQIHKLKEYKTTLIDSVVTGKVRVE
jgi:type I restriction enzyme S subunit